MASTKAADQTDAQDTATPEEVAAAAAEAQASEPIPGLNLPPDEPAEDDDIPVALRYRGDGSMVFHGIPARDLTRDEAAEIRRTRPVIYAAMIRRADPELALYERVKETA